MNISKPISTASRLRVTFTRRPRRNVRATDPRDAQPRSGTPQAAQLAAATRGVTMSELVSSWIESELSRVGRTGKTNNQ